MKSLLVAAGLLLIAASAAEAGFDSWTADSENDPFSGGRTVKANYLHSANSGAVITCEGASGALEIRVVPGWRAEDLNGYDPTDDIKTSFAVAIDEELLKLDFYDASANAVGNLGLVAAIVKLDGTNAKIFLDSFVEAKSQVAFRDGISEGPILLSARGSTSAGKKLLDCMEKSE